MKNKIILLFPIILLAASCNLFKSATVAGVVKTNNGGADWQFTNGTKSQSTVSLSVLNVSKLYVDSVNHEIIYASGYNGGLYKSDNTGTSWARILDKIFVYDFVFDPNNNKIIYVCGNFGDFGKALKTEDGGKSWQEIYNDASSGNIVRSIAINPQNVSQLFIGTQTGSVIRSSDAGLSWQLVKNFSSDRVQKIVWKQDAIYLLLRESGLFKSTDFGQNFENLTPGATNLIVQAKKLFRSSNETAYNQFYADTISSNLIYVTTGAGLYKTTDGGKTWALLPLPVNSGVANTRGIDVAIKSSNTVFASVGATIYKSTDGGVNWQTHAIATKGFINYILIDQKFPQTVYAGIFVSQ